jgi:hypothetical protein
MVLVQDVLHPPVEEKINCRRYSARLRENRIPASSEENITTEASPVAN